MKRVTILLAVLVIGVSALPNVASAQCLVVEVMNAADNAIEGDLPDKELTARILELASSVTEDEVDPEEEYTVELAFKWALVPVLRAEAFLLNALGKQEEARIREAEARRMADPGFDMFGEGMDVLAQSEENQALIAEAMEESGVLHDSSKAHLMCSRPELLSGWIRAFELGGVIADSATAVLEHFQGIVANLNEAKETLENANRLQKARALRNVERLTTLVATLEPKVNFVGTVAEQLPPYLGKFGGNYVKYVKFYRANNIKMPSNLNDVI